MKKTPALVLFLVLFSSSLFIFLTNSSPERNPAFAQTCQDGNGVCLEGCTYERDDDCTMDCQQFILDPGKPVYSAGDTVTITVVGSADTERIDVFWKSTYLPGSEEESWNRIGDDDDFDPRTHTFTAEWIIPTDQMEIDIAANNIGPSGFCSGNPWGLEGCSEGSFWEGGEAVACCSGCQKIIKNDYGIDDAFNSLADKVAQILDNMETAYPLYEQVGYDVNDDEIDDTLASLDAKYDDQSPEEQAEWRARLFCTSKPPTTPDKPEGEWLEDWAKWRGCMAASNWILALYHMRNYIDHGQSEIDSQRAETHFYEMIVQMDALATGPEYGTPLSGLTNPSGDNRIYTLRDTHYTNRYLPDFTSGVYNGFGWGLSLGILPRYYCTSRETPHDPGKSCKTINLWERIRLVASAITTKVASQWMIHSNGTLRTEYWNNAEYWENPRGYMVTPNGNPDVGWNDLSGRRMVTIPAIEQPMSPHFFHWQMSGMAQAAKAVLDEGGIYQEAYDFGLTAAAHTFSLDPDNPNPSYLGENYAQYNPYGQPVRSLSILCSGTENPQATDPLDICQGGEEEWFQYDGTSPLPNHCGLTYSAQHLDVLIDTLEWGELPEVYRDNALNYYYALKATFYKDGDSYTDINDGGFNADTINKYFPSHLTSSCRTSGYDFYRGSRGIVVSKGGETPAELLATAIPALAHIVGQVDTTKAWELLAIADQALTPLTVNPLSPEDANCAGSGWAPGVEENLYARSAVQFANLATGYLLFQKVPYPTLPKSQIEGDLDGDRDVDSQDLKILLENWGDPSAKPGADLNTDGIVNGMDFGKLVKSI